MFYMTKYLIKWKSKPYQNISITFVNKSLTVNTSVNMQLQSKTKKKICIPLNISIYITKQCSICTCFVLK
jgi:hypothetical protein